MPKQKRRLSKVLDVLDKIYDQLSQKRNLNILLDFDGTLAPIAETPDQARIPYETLGLLKKLNDLPNVFIAVISGRSLKDIQENVNVKGVTFAGNHGLEISGVKRTEIVPNASQVVRSIRKICDDLSNVLVTVPGAWVENKSLTASVHYRSVTPHLVPELNRLVGQITARYIERDIIRLTRGKKVIEIRPNIKWNKGYAVSWILKKLAKTRANTIYIGDDVTDEDVFQMLNGALTIKVVKEIRTTTHAKYYLANPTEVRFFLQWLFERLTETRK